MNYLLYTLIAFGPPSHTDSRSAWPQFRGPLGNGVAVDSRHPTEWQEKLNIAWQQSIPGAGWASPVVAGKRVLICTAVGVDQPKGFRLGAVDPRAYGMKPKGELSFEMHCLNRSNGKLLWKKSVAQASPKFPIHASNTYATESPVTDGQRVVAYFGGMGLVVCLDLEGNEIWRQDVGAYPTSAEFGSGSSLCLGESSVFLQCDNQESSFLVSLDMKTGKQIWRKKRGTGTSWSTPLLWQNRLRSELIVCGRGVVTSYDPKDGNELWRATNMGGSFSASPATDPERLYFGNSGPGQSGPLIAIKAGASGEIDLGSDEEHPFVAWRKERCGPGLASPVCHDGFLYVLSRGILSCFDVENGKRIYRERLPDARSVAASLWVASNRLFVLDESGATHVLRLGRKFELLRTNRVDGMFWATPSVAEHDLLLRGAEKIYCVRRSI